MMINYINVSHPWLFIFFINNIWLEFAKLLAKRPITIHEFFSTGMDCLSKTFFWVYLKLIMLIPCIMVALFMFVFIWLSPLLLTVALAGPVRPADKDHLTEKKVSWYLRKLFKYRQPFFIGDDYYVWILKWY